VSFAVLFWLAVATFLTVLGLSLVFIRNWTRRKHWSHTEGR
jgi:hypothetical protein